MAKSKRGRKPYDPAADLERRAKSRAAEDRAMRAEGIDPKIARYGDEPLTKDRIEALERQGYAVVRADSDTARNHGRSTVAVDHQGRQVKPSHKADIWQQLYARDGLTKAQLGAVRDLQDLMAKRAGLGGRDEKMAYARDKADEPLRDPCLVTDQMLDAAKEMDLTLSLVGPPSSRLLTALLWPEALSERATMQKAMRRCAATLERDLAEPKNGARPGAWQQAVRDFEDKKKGRTKPRISVERRVCEALNEADAKRCDACGAPMPEDVKDESGKIIARPGVEMLSVEEDWRAIVARTSGCTRKESQGELLRFAAQALVDVRPQVQAAFGNANKSKRERRDPQALEGVGADHPFLGGGGPGR